MRSSVRSDRRKGGDLAQELVIIYYPTGKMLWYNSIE